MLRMRHGLRCFPQLFRNSAAANAGRSRAATAGICAVLLFAPRFQYCALGRCLHPSRFSRLKCAVIRNRAVGSGRHHHLFRNCSPADLAKIFRLTACHLAACLNHRTHLWLSVYVGLHGRNHRCPARTLPPYRQMVFRRHGIGRLQAFGISAGINICFIVLQYALPAPH